MKKDTTLLLTELKETQTKIISKKEHLRTVFIDGQSGNGSVVATITGNKQIVNIAIDESLLSNKTALEEHLIIALNDAMNKASQLREKEITAIKEKGFPYLKEF
tara:strand:+ start:6681 stop:6992 length:312 start_codon:yes stop_codon:yes gene_type:complete